MALRMIAWTPMTGMITAEEEVSTVIASLAIGAEAAVTVRIEDEVIEAVATDEAPARFPNSSCLLPPSLFIPGY